MHKRHLRLVVSAVVLLAIYLVLIWWQLYQAEVPETALIVFKLPRSGSTWFTERLNSEASIYVSKEIIQSADAFNYSLQERASHVAEALKQPTDKLARKHSLLPSGRFVEDYVSSFKLFHRLTVVGLTLNPEHAQGQQVSCFGSMWLLTSTSSLIKVWTGAALSAVLETPALSYTRGVT
jgi:hypothetical protein